MKIKSIAAAVLVAGAAGLLAGPGLAQDIPGFSLGGFYEYRVENQIEEDNLAFSYYGARLAFRDERWVEIFLDGGAERMSFDPLKDSTAACFGIGATFWLMRGDPGWGPIDLGLFGAGYFADYSGVKLQDTPLKSDIQHFRGLAQMVIRGYINQDFKAFLRGGVQYSKLDPSGDLPDDLIDDADLSKIKPAINAGVELQLVENLIAVLELNYSESVGGAARLGYWF